MKAILFGLQRRSGELSDALFEIDGVTSGAELIAAYRRGKYDAIFLDIVMPEIDGMELARQIRRVDWDVKLVFVTCMDERLPDGYDVMAADFIVKPVAAERVEKLILKLRRIERQRLQQAGDREVRLKGGAAAVLRLADTHYFESRLHYVKAVAANGELEFRATMEDMLKMVEGKGFVRAHRAYLVNMKYAWMRSEGGIGMISGAKIPVGKNYAGAVAAAFKNLNRGVLL
jgi:DNA-binding LytR/AlgR family response regulator